MPITDSNEVSAWIRACQDPGTLQDISNFVQQRIDLLQTTKGGKEAKKPFLNMSEHTSGGDLQPPMTGPALPPPGSANTAEQAEINDALVRQQIEEDRQSDKAAPRTVAIGQQSQDGGSEGDDEKTAKKASAKRSAVKPAGKTGK